MVDLSETNLQYNLPNRTQLTDTTHLITFNLKVMKSISRMIFVIILLLIGSGVHAQRFHKKSKTPRWVSDRGFWQIETNIHTPNKNVVYFFDNDQTLIYKENVDGVVLDLRKKEIKMRLKKALEAAINAWNKDHRYRDDQQLVSMFFRK